MRFEVVGKIILMFALILLIVGGLLYLVGRLGFKGLPGDISYEKEGFKFYFPIVTCLVVSLILTVIINLILSFLNR